MSIQSHFKGRFLMVSDLIPLIHINIVGEPESNLKTLTLLSLLVVTMLTVQAQIQYPVNGDFEDWTTASFAGTPYDSLVGWDTPQRLATALAVPDTVTYRTDVTNSGSAACLLISKEVTIAGLITTVVPGSISTGIFFVNLFTQEFGVTGGAAIDCKPTAFEGFYQYAPSGVDTANIVVYLTSASGDTVVDRCPSFHLHHLVNGQSHDFVPPT